MIWHDDLIFFKNYGLQHVNVLLLARKWWFYTLDNLLIWKWFFVYKRPDSLQQMVSQAVSWTVRYMMVHHKKNTKSNKSYLRLYLQPVGESRDHVFSNFHIYLIYIYIYIYIGIKFSDNYFLINMLLIYINSFKKVYI